MAERDTVRERFYELLEDEDPHHPWAIRHRRQQMGVEVDLAQAKRMADWAWDTNQEGLARTLDGLLDEVARLRGLLAAPPAPAAGEGR